MRIRKRRVPLPLSSLSPVPLSDLYSSGAGSSPIPPVQLILRPAAPSATDDIDKSSKPSDQAATNWRSIGRHDAVDHPELGINGDQAQLITNDSSVSTASRVASQSAQVHLPSNSLGRGGKKGRNREDNDDEEVVEGEEDKNVGTADSKSKGGASPSGGGRKRGRGLGGGTVMEGSRCSRVNGRGWRCCQPTLVGYSLCEHHLGKGRLRSMTSVRRTQPAGTAPGPRSSREAKDEEDEDYVDEKIKDKKGMKLKARSMSSLLGQDDNSNADSSGATLVTAGMPEATGSDNNVKEHGDEAA